MSREALIIVDLQRDFCEGGSLAVPGGDEIVGTVNTLAGHFGTVIATLDWHPPDHCSFIDQGGPWPPHCVQGSPGAEFHPGLRADAIDEIVETATDPSFEAYSGFDHTDLADRLQRRDIEHIYIVGLATDYCVRATALDGIRHGFNVYLVEDAVRAVDVSPGDGERAIEEMRAAGAKVVTSDEVLEALTERPVA